MNNWPSPKFKQVHVLGARERWSLGQDAFFLMQTLKSLGIRYTTNRVAYHQVVYLPNRYVVPRSKYHLFRNKVLFDFFHGHPETSQEFAVFFKKLCAKKANFVGVRVSNRRMENLLLENGFSGKVFRIPIGVHLDWFPMGNASAKRKARRELGIPMSAVVVGSFQKDGNGWGKGSTPKHIKGPDVLLKVLELLQSRIPELFVLLTGPSRGFVRQGLTELGIRYKHVELEDKHIGKAYHALDAYVVTSREEGGPKAVLEAMATGVPLITTRVGQAADLVEHEKNGWVTELDDYEALAHFVQSALCNAEMITEMVLNGRRTAEKYSHDALVARWSAVMNQYLDPEYRRNSRVTIP